MIAGRLTMRAQLQRDTATASDAYGGPVAPVWADQGEPLACFVWSTGSGQQADGGKTVNTGDFRAMFTLDADVRQNDRLASITDRRGAELVKGTLLVLGPVEHKHTHLEATLKRYD